jgi:hypothetical protein
MAINSMQSIPLRKRHFQHVVRPRGLGASPYKKTTSIKYKSVAFTPVNILSTAPSKNPCGIADICRNYYSTLARDTTLMP